ncbi:uncharacterized protein LOC121858102 [Homarus americanus]|uniref:uncharacterized protein LOC121858102 n=1 Tax=Homarus americanus TaxID=6706 RepID=UPI001C475C8D|nr:uncharacterized protein LOC121858102 [Homarus americanus]
MKMSYVMVPVALALLLGVASSTLVIPLATTAGTSLAITAGTGSLAGVAAAAAGVAGVGLVASALLSRRREEPRGYGAAPDRRYKRDVDEERLEELFAMVAKMDTHGCGMRHVCEVYKKPEHQLNLREHTIRALLGDKPEPVSPKKAKHPRSFYQSAAVLGREGQDCYNLYTSCPLTYEEVNEYLDNLDLQVK